MLKSKDSFPAMNIKGKINGLDIVALLDTGASISCMYTGDALKADIEIVKSKVILRAANNTMLKTSGVAIIPFEIKGKILNIKAMCVDDIAMCSKLIIGLDFLKDSGANIDCGSSKITLKIYDLELSGEKSQDGILSNIKRHSISNDNKATLYVDTHILPDEMKLVEICCKNKKRLYGKFLFTPNCNWDNYFSDLIVHFSGKVTSIIVMNNNKHTVIINRSHVIGTLEKLADDHLIIEASNENINIIRLIDSVREKYSGLDLDTEKFRTNDLVNYICSITDKNSVARIFLLLKLFVSSGHCINKIDIDDNQKIIKDSEYKDLSDELYEEYLYETDVRALSPENRKILTVELIKRYLADDHYANMLIPLLSKYTDAIALSDIDLGEFSLVTATINYFGPVINMVPSPIPLKFRDQLEKEIERLLRANVITETDSIFNNNVVIVPKKNTNSLRLTLDSRAINIASKASNTVLPKISEILFSIGKIKFFTSLDLLAAYWSIYLDEGSTDYTAFTVHNARYKFLRLPMGLRQSSSIFQKVMYLVLDKLIVSDQTYRSERLHVYLDDLFITSENVEGNLELLEKVLSRFALHKLKLKIKKCSFLKKEVKFLGHVIDEKGFRPIRDNILKINSFPRPKSTKEVKSFLGIINYYRSYISNVSTLADPLYKLTSRVKKFYWSEEAQTSFEKLKKVLTPEDKLFHPEFNLPFIIRSDSSEGNFGGVLSQRSPEGIEFPLLFLSKKLTSNEKAWRIADKEMGAVNYCLKFLRNLILGYEIHVVVDHFNLVNMFSCALKNVRMLRMAISIAEFAPNLYFVSGHDHVSADYLSRVFISTLR